MVRPADLLPFNLPQAADTPPATPHNRQGTPMAERNPFHELLENLDEDDWEQIEEELLHDDNGPASPGRTGWRGQRRKEGGGYLVDADSFLVSSWSNVLSYTDGCGMTSQLTPCLHPIGVRSAFCCGALALAVLVLNVCCRRMNRRGCDTPVVEAIRHRLPTYPGCPTVGGFCVLHGHRGSRLGRSSSFTSINSRLA